MALPRGSDEETGGPAFFLLAAVMPQPNLAGCRNLAGLRGPRYTALERKTSEIVRPTAIPHPFFTVASRVVL